MTIKDKPLITLDGGDVLPSFRLPIVNIPGKIIKRSESYIQNWTGQPR